MDEGDGKMFEYNSELDSLYLYSGINENVLGVINIEDLIFDVGVSGKLVGLEIENASKVFNVNPQLFSKLDNCKLFVKKQGNLIFLGFRFNIMKEIFNYSYMVAKDKIAITC
ncbi:MAG: DUF2283 domain-containing protein [Nanoarchaeota archaeon]|nr:DUF2283 domain-containing protein [Nanoarchaeota archaeon]